MNETVTNPDCSYCDGTGIIEIMGGSDKEEWGVVDEKPCPECKEE